MEEPILKRPRLLFSGLAIVFACLSVLTLVGSVYSVQVTHRIETMDMSYGGQPGTSSDPLTFCDRNGAGATGTRFGDEQPIVKGSSQRKTAEVFRCELANPKNYLITYADGHEGLDPTAPKYEVNFLRFAQQIEPSNTSTPRFVFLAILSLAIPAVLALFAIAMANAARGRPGDRLTTQTLRVATIVAAVAGTLFALTIWNAPVSGPAIFEALAAVIGVLVCAYILNVAIKVHDAEIHTA